MKKMMARLAIVAGVALMAGLAQRGAAYVERMYSLKEVLDECTNICVGKIESVDTEKKQIVAKIERDLKGKNPYAIIRMNINTSLPQFIPYMMKKVKPGQEIVVFYKKQGQAIACLCYMDRFWFQLYGQDLPDHSKMWWRMSHVEIRMNRTWNRTLKELVGVITNVLAGKMEPPPPNPNVPPFDVKEELEKLAAAEGGQGGQKAQQKLFRRYIRLPHGATDARGVSWIDFDGDGDLDAYFCSLKGNQLYRCEPGGIFFRVTDLVGLSGASAAAAWADYNGDGRPDLLLSTPKLFTNVGGKFRDDTALVPKVEKPVAQACAWIDYDGDGLPDILIPNGERGILVFRNTGNDKARFEDVSDKVGLGSKGPGRAKGDFVSVADFDGDGFSDFLYNAGHGMLFHNTGEGSFELVENSGIKFTAQTGAGAGVAWGDYDNDGDLDLFVPQPDTGKLFRNKGDGTFEDVTSSAGDLTKIAGQWTAAAWGDIDRDGWLDLYVGMANGDARLFMNNGDGTFANRVEPLGLYHLAGNTRVSAATLADFDGDGDLDILANSFDGRCTIFVNDMDGRDPQRLYLIVKPKGTKGLIGAQVRLFDEKDRLVGLRELGVAQNAGSQADLAAFFGIRRGKYKVTVCMSDGGFGQSVVEIKQEGLTMEVGAK